MTGDDKSDPLAETAAAIGEGSSPRALAETAVDSLEPKVMTVTAAMTIGRFVVIEKLGQGGMGIVLAAYDPQLDRRVAIKMLHDNVSAAQGVRLEREAKAMAQLSHPNVVTVHETGMFGERLYIAMEYVDGQTFGAWLRAAPRSRDAILDLMMQAARGLAAAHAVGLVHRDFKPENVLVGKDGRVRVSDFGLVSSAADRSAARDSSDLVVTVKGTGPAAPSTSSPSSLTQTGAVMGTPLYMAPEQHDGRVADAKADQFGFSVTLWQALCDELPYGADTYEDLVANVTGGKLRSVPRGANITATLRAILTRGLASDPADRFPSMDALVAAIARARRPTRWPWFLGGGVALAGVAVAGAFLLRGGSRDPCAGGEQRVAAVWGGARTAKLAAAIHATGAPAADTVATQIVSAIDHYTSAWAVHHHDVCAATAVRGEQSAELLDLRMHCLDRELGEVDAMIARFVETTTRDDVFRALDATSALPGLAACDDVARLRAAIQLPDDPAKRAAIETLERRAADAMSFDRMGQWAKARALVDPLIAEVHAVDYPPLEATLVLLRAGEEARDGNVALAEQHYHDAAEAAARARDDERIAQSWTDLMSLLASKGSYADALALAPIAKTAVERVSDHPLLGARYDNAVAGIHLAQGKYPEAKREYEHALELVRKDGSDNELVGPALTNLGTVQWYVGDSQNAAVLLEQARVWFVARYGATHPSLGYIQRNLGDLAVQTGKLDDAIEHYTQALAIFEGAHGPDHIDDAIALEPLCYAYARKGDLVKARAFGERALAVREAKLGPDHVSLATTLDSLADVDLADGLPASAERATQRLQRSVDIQVKAYGADYVRLPDTLDRLANAWTAAGKPQLALGVWTRSLELRAKTAGEHGDELANDYQMRAWTQDHLQHADLALQDYERGLAAAVSPAAQARIGFVKAHTLWQRGRHADALAAATTARAAVATDPTSTDLRTALDSWIAHPGT